LIKSRPSGYVSEQKSRSADRAKNLVDDEFTGADWDAIREALSAFEGREFVCLDRQVGRHPDSKRVTIERDGDLETVGQAFLGLSATGKSTLTGHGCWLDEPEGAEMLQDDVCALTADGTVDFEDTDLTSNGRAVIRREHLDSAADDIDMADVDQLFFITRNPGMPPVARLTDRQAAVAFMLGESIQTSAGDPDAAGKSIRVVGTNPFIIGPEGEEGNRFYELVSANDCDCFLLNTGHVGPGKTDIGVRESVGVLVSIARDDVAWEDDERMGLELPTELPGFELDAFYPPDHYDDFETELTDLRAERRAYLAQFDNLDRTIRGAVY